MKHTVICGFSGIGKSTAENKSREVTDMESSGFSWIWEAGVNTGRNPAFPENYISRLNELMEQNHSNHKFLLSCHQKVRDCLKSNGIPYIIVLPRKELKNEYLKRWLQRGSDIEFIEIMYYRWDEMIDSCEKDDAPKIYLEQGEYLSDLICL
jgi:hypothetical protein